MTQLSLHLMLTNTNNIMGTKNTFNMANMKCAAFVFLRPYISINHKSYAIFFCITNQATTLISQATARVFIEFHIVTEDPKHIALLIDISRDFSTFFSVSFIALELEKITLKISNPTNNRVLNSPGLHRPTTMVRIRWGAFGEIL